MTSDGLTVTCKSHYMDVALSRLVYPWLDPGTLHMNLIQSNCAAYNVTDMHIRIQAPLYGCGTRTVRKNKFVVESRNVFIARVKRPPGFRITYLPDTYFPFVCRYEITRSAGEKVFKPLGKSSILVICYQPDIIYQTRGVFHRSDFQTSKRKFKIKLCHPRRLKISVKLLL